ncbi:MAG: hypothetical protein ACLFNU_11495 [Bacteroidales bacterium]
MITVNVGRTFLKAYNKKYEKELSPKEFFEKEYFELFFNHNKYMQWPTNSPFVQMKKGQKPESLSAEDRKEKLDNLHKKINDGERDASIAIGFPASEIKEFATTSGLITDLGLAYSDEDVYLSWIGSGLSVGVAGGLSILFDQPEILLKTYEGWKVYRKFLNDPTLEKLAGNKITSWNGQWLSYVYSKDFRDSFDFASLNILGFFKHDNNGTVIETVKWSRLFFNLSQQFPEQTFTGYVFSFGQMNKTMGFFPFRFQQALKLITFYKKLFGKNAVLEDRSYYENMYGIHIKRACEMGAFGIQALEPDGLRKYYNSDKMPNLLKSNVNRGKNQTDEDFENSLREAEKKDYENKIIPFRIYKTWLLAMITKNKEEMSDYTREVAKAIYEYRVATQKDKAGSTKVANTIKSLLASKSKRNFIEGLTEIISDDKFNKLALPVFNELRDRAHLMNNEDFGYFVVLLKFDYAYQERIS